MEKTPYAVSSSRVGFVTLDEPGGSQETNGNVPVVVKRGLNAKKLAIIVGSVIFVGVIAAVAVGIGVAILNKDDKTEHGSTPSPEQRDPMDGEWTYWDKWSDCSVTCGGGIQVRRRTCNAPPPLFGGKDCPGNDIQTQECSKWNCPDCSRSCPTGGTLSKDCEVCLCPQDTLFGIVRNSKNIPLHGVDVYLSYKQWESVATTNYWGEFKVGSLCAAGTTLIYRKEGYMQNETWPVSVNATHHKASSYLRKYEKPSITTQPINKYRFAGTSATLCCKAEGFPQNITYSWLKDGVQVSSRLNSGSLTLPNLVKSDQASYTCVAESTAGIVRSETVFILVKDRDKDTCDRNPLPKKERLPAGCFAVINGAKTSELEIGRCAQIPCITAFDHDNGTCGEWWQSKCCDVETVDKTTVECTNFSYTLNRIKTCGCNLGTAVTKITGLAFGFRNGSQVPFQRGLVYIDGDKTTYTSSGGMFTFTVPFDKTKVILVFQEDINNEFLDAIKPLSITPGSTMNVRVILQLRSKPLVLNTRMGMSIPLNNLDGAAPISTISIPQDAIVDADGDRFEGEANIFLNVMDPRILEDLQNSDGEFFYSDDNGNPAPLETFGMFQIQVEDKAGNGLLISGPITTTMDQSLFNVSNDNDGNPDLSTWFLDPNTGNWIESGKYKYSQSHGRRKLLNSQIEGVIDPNSIPDLKLTYTKITTRSVLRGNIDKPIRYRYVNIIERHPNTAKDEACYVRVQVFADFTLLVPLEGITVGAVTQDFNDLRYKGKYTSQTDHNGIACVGIFCNSKIFIYIPDQPQMYATDTHDLPSNYLFKNINNLTQVQFTSTDPFVGGKRPEDQVHSPVYDYKQSPSCKYSKTRGSFKFAPIKKEHHIHPALGTLTTHNKRLAWYPRPVSDPLHKSCFIKINIKSSFSHFDIITKSFIQDDPARKDEYGTYQTSPYWDESTGRRYSKGACIEFRCPGLVVDGSTKTQNIATLVWIFVTDAMGTRCKIDSKVIQINQTGFGNNFKFLADPTDQYGEKYGVFIRNEPADSVRRMCESGTTSGAVSTTMKPDKNPALQLTCA